MKAMMPSRAKMALMMFMVWLPFTYGHREALGTALGQVSDPKAREDTHRHGSAWLSLEGPAAGNSSGCLWIFCLGIIFFFSFFFPFAHFQK